MQRAGGRRAVAAAVLAAGLLAPVWAVPAGAQSPPVVDYDADDDGLIEIASLAQLNAIRWDLDGDGAADVYPADFDGYTGHDPDGAAKLAAAFPDAAAGMGCPAAGCDGYELAADLDFDTNGNGRADAGDEFWNGGRGWEPIFGADAVDSEAKWMRFAGHLVPNHSPYFSDRPNSRARMFTAVFEGNGRTIANLHIDRRNQRYIGLFGYIGPAAHVRNLGLSAPNPDSGVRGKNAVGAVAGQVERARVSGVWSDLDVSGVEPVGGLVGTVFRFGSVIESYATGDVTAWFSAGGAVGTVGRGGVAAVYATGDVLAEFDRAGGLVGWVNGGHLRAGYATGSVKAWFPSRQFTRRAGGLVGSIGRYRQASWLHASYATGQVSGPWLTVKGGLSGGCLGASGPPAEGANYWDTESSGRATSPHCGVGYTTAQLQAPTGYEGIYADWDVEVDLDAYDWAGSDPWRWTSDESPALADGAGDDPWDFGTSSEYPVLKYCAAKPGIDTADGLAYCPLQPWRQRGRPEPPPVTSPPTTPPTPTLPTASVAGDGSVGEGSFAVFTLTVAPPPSGGLVVQVTVRSSDFGVLSQTRVVRVPVSGTAKVYVATAVDYDSVDGWVTVSVDDDPADVDAYAVSAAQGAATVTVLDDD